MKHLVYNAIKTPDGTVLESTSRHDYVTYKDSSNGLEYMVDGGLDYLRRTQHPNHPYQELTLYDDDNFEKVREVLKWGSRGPDGDRELRWIALCDMETDHIERVLELPYTKDFIKELLKKELKYREAEDAMPTQ